MELKVWIGSVQRVISGVNTTTTSHEVIVALAQATGKVGKFILIEKWRDYEKTLAPSDCPLTVAQKFGDYSHEVQFILRQTAEAGGNTGSIPSRRLAEAKSPKPQRRTRGGIKKSLSFSAGPQSSSPSRSPKLSSNLHSSAIPEEAQSAGKAYQYNENYYSTQSYVGPSEGSAFRPIRDEDRWRGIEEGGKHRERARSQERGRSHRSQQSAHPNDDHIEYHLVDQPAEQRDPNKKKKRSSSAHRAQRQRDVASPGLGSAVLYDSRPDSEYYEMPAEPTQMSKLLEERAAAERESRLREAEELQQSMVNYERRLTEERRRLSNVESDISKVTSEEEQKWGDLYDCRDEIQRALTTVHKLELELEQCDEVLLSEELNVLFIRRDEMEAEIEELTRKLEQCQRSCDDKSALSGQYSEQIKELAADNARMEGEIDKYEEETTQLQQRVNEKKRFLEEAEEGYRSVCDDLHDAEVSLDKRKQMLVELERELREYNLKSFINTGLSSSDKGDAVSGLYV